MANFDTNKDGTLDKKELRVFTTAFLAKMMPGHGEPDDEQFETIFKKFDTNGNGTIEKAEISTFVQEVYPFVQEVYQGESLAIQKPESQPKD